MHDLRVQNLWNLRLEISQKRSIAHTAKLTIPVRLLRDLVNDIGSCLNFVRVHFLLHGLFPGSSCGAFWPALHVAIAVLEREQLI